MPDDDGERSQHNTLIVSHSAPATPMMQPAGPAGGAANGGKHPLGTSSPSPSPLVMSEAAFQEWSTGTLDSFQTSLSTRQQNDFLKRILRVCTPRVLFELSNNVLNESRHDFLDWLPDELSELVFAYLDVPSLCQASLVCKKWFRFVMQSDALWKRFCNASHLIKYLLAQSAIQVPYSRILVRQSRQYSHSSYDPSALLTLDEETPAQQHRLSADTGNSHTSDSDGDAARLQVAAIKRSRFREIFAAATQVCSQIRYLASLSFDHNGVSLMQQELTNHDLRICNIVRFNDSMVFTGSYDRTVRCWDLSTMTCTRVFPSSTCAMIRCDSRSESIFIASFDCTLTWMSAATGQTILTFRGHVGAVFQVDYSLDFKVLLSGSSDNTAKLWSLETGEPLKTYRHFRRILNIGLLKVSESEYDQFLQQVRLQQQSPPAAADPSVGSEAAPQSGDALSASAQPPGTFASPTFTGQPSESLAGFSNYQPSFRLLPARTRSQLAMEDDLNVPNDFPVVLAEPDQPGPAPNHSALWKHRCSARDGHSSRLLVCVACEDSITFWSPDDNTAPLYTVTLPVGEVISCIDFRNSWMAIGYEGGRVEVCSTVTLKKRFSLFHGQRVDCIRFSDPFLCVSSGPSVYLYDNMSGARIAVVKCWHGRVVDMLFQPEQAILLFAVNNHIVLQHLLNP